MSLFLLLRQSRLIPNNLNKRLTILHIIDSLAQGGAEILLSQTVRDLPQYNHVVVYLYDTKNDMLASFSNFKVYKLNLVNKLLILPSVIRLRKIIKENNVEIVHGHLWLSTLLARLATPKKVRLLFTLHSIMSKDAFNSKLRLFLDKLLYSRKQELIAVSEAVQCDYTNYVHVTGRQYILHNFVDEKFFQLPVKKAYDQPLKLVAVGNLKEAKNYPYLLEALSQLELNYSLDIYGEGPQAEMLKAIVNEKKLPVSFKGKEPKIETVLPNYDLFVMASSHEGYGIALAEAMAAALPVFVSDIPAFREVAGDAAFYFSLKKSGDFAVQLTHISNLHKHGNLIDWRLKCRERAKKMAAKETYFAKLESIYNPSNS